MNGKGSKRRPSQVPEEHVQSEWDRIFNKKQKDKSDDQPNF